MFHSLYFGTIYHFCWGLDSSLCLKAVKGPVEVLILTVIWWLAVSWTFMPYLIFLYELLPCRNYVMPRYMYIIRESFADHKFKKGAIL